MGSYNSDYSCDGVFIKEVSFLWNFTVNLDVCIIEVEDYREAVEVLMKKLWLVLGIFALLCAGCGTPLAPDGSVDEDSITPVEVDNDSVFVSPVSVLPTPGGMEMGNVDDELQSLVEDDLGLERDSLQLLTIEAKTWGDTSLGCPKPGMAYAQVLTDGWLIVYRGPDGQEIPVHAERGLKNYVICSEEFQPLPPPENGDLGVLPVLRAAVTLLAETLDVSSEKVAVQGIAQKQWSNSCLGCAGPEENCLTVITPGYQVQMTVGGRGYAVHTNADGSAIRMCEKSDSADPGGN